MSIPQTSDGGITDFCISGQSFINENYHNSRASHEFDMKLGPVTKLHIRNTATLKSWTMTSSQQRPHCLFFRFFSEFQVYSHPQARFGTLGL